MEKKSKEKSSKIVLIFLISSMIVNLVFVVDNYYMGSNKMKKNWSHRAGEVAEGVAEISCSGHGRAYLDGVVVDDGEGPFCECNTCFQGTHCSLFLPDCVADANSGDPLFLEAFWMDHAVSSAVVVAGWHRMSYSYNDQTFISQRLEKSIRELHQVVGNAITNNRFIVFGAGSTQILAAAAYALSFRNSSTSPPAKIVLTRPYYALYKMQAEIFDSSQFKFEGDTSSLKNSSGTVSRDDEPEVIEFVTSPNNPDGRLNKAVITTPFAKSIYDRAYYWPHYTPIISPADEDFSVFTISKLTGHAGSRFGWAVIKDKKVFDRANQFIQLNSMGVSRDTQLRAFQLFKSVLEEDDGRAIFEFGYNTMKTRWEKLIRTFSSSKRFSLQKTEPRYCNFYHKLKDPSPAYAWVKCEFEEDNDCYAVLKAAKIIGRAGNVFGVDDRYVRLSIVKRQDDFDVLIKRLNELIPKEDGAKTM